MLSRLNLALCCVLMVCCIVLGGGTRPGFLSDAILQLIALPMVLYFGWLALDAKEQPGLRPALLFLGLVLGLAALQLVPLPPSVWTLLPGHDRIAESYVLLGLQLPWWPISMSPNSTWLGILAMMPPIAVFLGAVTLKNSDRRKLVVVVIAMGVVSVVLGMLQIAQGPESTLRFFTVTNASDAVGFFANRNHYSALVYSVTVLCFPFCLFAAYKFSDVDEADQSRLSAEVLVPIVVSFLTLVVVLAGQMIARSRAGLGLTILALFGIFALTLVGRRGSSATMVNRLMYGAVGIVVIFSLQFSLYRVMERFSSDPLADSRLPFARNTIDAALAFMPFGSGLGTFVPIYGLFEKPEDTFAAYANHAHNDYLEMWLEWGIFGLVLAGLLGGWFLMRAIAIWRARGSPDVSSLDSDIARSATVVMVLILLHCAVDYPLRTSAMAAIFALSCALMIAPASRHSTRRAHASSSSVVAGAGAGGPNPAQEDLAFADESGQAEHVAKTRETETEIDTPLPSSTPSLSNPAETKSAEAGGFQSLDAPPEKSRPGDDEGRDTKPDPSKSDELWGGDVEWPDEWRPSKK